jgi:putative transcriptional regulator
LACVLVMTVVLGILGAAARLRADAAAAKESCYFLVASDQMPDPTFQQSVILMVPSAPDNPIIAGIIVNKPTNVTVGRLLGSLSGLKHPTEKLYYGGPVDDDEPILLLRSPHPLKGTTRLMDKLYAGTSPDAITDILTHPWSPQDTRLVMGRAQWTRDQLRMEILRGAWDAMPADVDLIFKTDPGAVWRGLQKHSHLREIELHPDYFGAALDEQIPLAAGHPRWSFATY